MNSREMKLAASLRDAVATALSKSLVDPPGALDALAKVAGWLIAYSTSETLRDPVLQAFAEKTRDALADFLDDNGQAASK
jgi:hypothetical protein